MKKSLIAAWIGIGLLVVSWMFPPWHRIINARTSHAEYALEGFLPIWMPRNWCPQCSIDTSRLVLIDASIALVTAGLVVSFRLKTNTP